MKDFTQMKNYYKIAGLCMGTGAICMAAAYCLSGFNLDNLDKNKEYTQRVESFSSSEVKNLMITDEETDIEIKTSNSDQIIIHLDESDTDYYMLTLDDGTLKVLKNSDESLTLFNFGFQRSDMTIELPASMLGSIAVENDNGSIYATGINAENLNLSTSNSSITLMDSNVENDITMTNNNASYTIDSVTCKGILKADTSNSRAGISNVTASEIILKTSNGQIEADTISADTIELKTSNGRAEAEKVDIEKKLSIETSNGNIEAILDGKDNDYSVSCDTSNGTCNVPTASGSKEVRLKSSNANIQLETE